MKQGSLLRTMRGVVWVWALFALVGLSFAQQTGGAGALIETGKSALLAGRHDEARDSFKAALDLEPKNSIALQGLGLAQLHLGEAAAARATLDAALAGVSSPSRALVINYASAALQSNMGPRAVKVLRDYLTANAKVVDEPVIDALGICLGQFDDAARRNRLFTDTLNFYDAQVKRLEPSYPGLKRWGIEWQDATKVDQLTTANTSVRREAGGVDQRLARMVAEHKTLTDATASHSSRMRGGGRNNDDEAADALRAEQLAGNIQRAIHERDTILARLTRPALPDSIKPISLNELAPEPAPTIASTKAGSSPVQAVLPPKRITSDAMVPVTRKPTTPVAPQATPEKVTDAPEKVTDAFDEVTDASEMLPDAPAAPVEKVKQIVTRYAVAFPIAPDLLVSSLQLTSGASKIDVQVGNDDHFAVEVVREDPTSGLVLLRVKGRKFAPMSLAKTFDGGAVQCPSLSGSGIFGASAVMLDADVRRNADGTMTASFASHPKLPGSPLLVDGKVVGIQLGMLGTNDRTRIPAIPVETLQKFLGRDLPNTLQANPDPLQVSVKLSILKEE